jgi:hypothetical protein
MKHQWQTYKLLELLPDHTASPHRSHSIIVLQLSRVWRSLANELNNHLVDEQRVYRLEECWKLDVEDCDRATEPNIWQKAWVFLNQPIFQWNPSTSSEPEIRQVSDQGGHIWWYAYDPMTGQKVYLESESEVQIWLEERLYYYY